MLLLRRKNSYREESNMENTILRVNRMSTILVTFFLLLVTNQHRQHHRAEASGVFELELIKLQQLDSRPKENNATSSKQIDKLQAASSSKHQQEAANLVRILVCLKEAFTSQLDGPCTFGNASLALSEDSIQQPASKLPASSMDEISQDLSASQNSTQQPGSLLTNIVRILFTFRWTKSFTIILTAEQLKAEPDNEHSPTTTAIQGRSTASRLSHGAASARLTNLAPDVQAAINGTPQSRSSNQLALLGSLFTKTQFIDRHVLTENEVLPNLEPNPNKPWASRFSRSLKSSLAYRFRVYCSLNYYGDGCTTFCRTRDDQFGHYNCSTTGQKICLNGWTGPDCDKAKCRPGCNQQHGYCEAPDTCHCRPGWSGPRCDECITYPGCQNGYCLAPWQCICQRNWGGVLCDKDLNYCGTHEPCKNNGTCQNIAPGRYKCNCLHGFTGVDCGISLLAVSAADPLTQISAGCALNPCLNGGTCYGFNNQIGDSSVAPLSESLEPGSLVNHAGELGDRYYRCQCEPGWTGDYCQWVDSASLSVTNLLLNTTNEKTPQSLANITTSTPDSITFDDTFIELQKTAQLQPIVTLIDSSHPPSSQLDMKHLISGVVISSVLGVFMALLLLAWCCLIAIERNNFPFIQMNIIREANGGQQVGEPVVSTTLRRMQEKIRNSFRRSSRGRIRAETKLSIENVLRPPKPPPSYEESSNICPVHKISSDYQPVKINFTPEEEEYQETLSKYLSIASQNRSRYNSGSTIVGNSALTTDLTTRSIFLSQVNGLT